MLSQADKFCTNIGESLRVFLRDKRQYGLVKPPAKMLTRYEEDINYLSYA